MVVLTVYATGAGELKNSGSNITCCGSALEEDFENGYMICRSCGARYRVEDIKTMADRVHDEVKKVKSSLQ